MDWLYLPYAKYFLNLSLILCVEIQQYDPTIIVARTMSFTTNPISGNVTNEMIFERDDADLILKEIKHHIRELKTTVSEDGMSSDQIRMK